MAFIRIIRDTCGQMRRMLVTKQTLDVLTGRVITTGEEWTTEECGIPLFTDTERERGTCRTCAEGYAIDTNYPVMGRGSKQ